MPLFAIARFAAKAVGSVLKATGKGLTGAGNGLLKLGRFNAAQKPLSQALDQQKPQNGGGLLRGLGTLFGVGLGFQAFSSIFGGNSIGNGLTDPSIQDSIDNFDSNVY